MRAKVGDTLHIHARHTAEPDQVGRITQIRGAYGAPPYLVEFPDGRVRLIFPGPDAVVEPAQPSAPAGRHRGRRLHTLRGW